MKNRQVIFNLISLIMGLFLVLSSSCEKDNNDLNEKTTAVFNPDITYGEMKDQEGNVYKTVTIGTQIWMAENLRTTRFNDGTAIPHITKGSEWSATKTGAYSNYNNTTSNDTIVTYGRMYNWYTINTGKLAPNGWHVPTYEEYKILIDYLGGKEVAGGKLKEAGTKHWNSSNAGGTNESGFTALPGGQCSLSCYFYEIGNQGLWWSATENGEDSAWFIYLYNGDNFVSIPYVNKTLGFSVRLVRD